LVSFAFYISTGLDDVVGFMAGIGYGIIIEYVAFKYGAEVKQDEEIQRNRS